MIATRTERGFRRIGYLLQPTATSTGGRCPLRAPDSWSSLPNQASRTKGTSSPSQTQVDTGSNAYSVKSYLRAGGESHAGFGVVLLDELLVTKVHHFSSHFGLGICNRFKDRHQSSGQEAER